MGLQHTTSAVFEVFVGVALHKCILAFSLGVRFVSSGSGLAGLLRAVLIFAAMSPAGITIGIVVMETSGEHESGKRHLATAILQGITTGTFLFVTFLEILAHEIKEARAASHEQMLKLLLCLFGYGAMAAVQFADS